MSVYVPEKRDSKIAISDLVRDLLSKVTEVKAGGAKMARTATFGFGAALFGFIFMLLLALSLITLLTGVLGFTWAVLSTTILFLVVTGIFAGLMMHEIRRNIDSIDID
jgi:uncharacterized membrane protein